MAITKIINIDVQDNLSETIKEVNALDKALDRVDDSVGDLSKSMDKNQQSVLDNGGAMGLLNDATGGYAMMVKDAVEASALFGKESKIATGLQKAYAFVMGTSTGAMKVFKLALIGTGIGALVVGIGLLIANFDKVKEVVFKFIPGLQAVADFIGMIVEKITDFVGVTSDLSRELDKIGLQAQTSLEKNKRFLDAYGDQLDEFTKRKIDLRQAYNEKVKELLANEELSQEEQQQRIEEARKRLVREIDKADSDRQAKNDERRKAEQEKINAANQVAAEKRKAEQLKEQQEAFEHATEMQRIADKVAEDKKIRNKQVAEEEEAEEFAQIDKSIAQLKRKEQAEKETADAQIELDRLTAESKQKNLNLIGGLLKDAANLIGESTTAGKALSIAATTIDTYQSATAAYKSMAGIPVVGPALGGVAAGLAVASGLANVKKILAVKVPGGRGGGGSAPSMSLPTGGGIGSAPQFNVVGNTGVNQIANTLQNQPPVQAIVVASNVTSAQSANRNIVQNASLG
jgi:chemotaxis protein histidine kinase CheA